MDTFEQIVKFIHENRWEYPFQLTRNMSLQDDLKIHGDDAVDFLQRFATEFDVNISELNLSEYFKPEGDLILPLIIGHVLGKEKRTYKKLTIGDLELAIKTRILR